MRNSADLIETLDRRFTLLEAQGGRGYLLQLIRFSEFVHDDAEVSPYTRSLISEFSDRIQIIDEALAQEVQPIVAYRQTLTALFPQLDDSQTPRPATVFQADIYDDSLAHFDDLLSGQVPEGESFSLSGSAYEDRTLPGKLLGILIPKVQDKVHDAREVARAEVEAGGKTAVAIPPDLDKVAAQLRTLNETHQFLLRGFINYRTTSPGRALLAIQDIATRLNRKPSTYTSLADRFKQRSMEDQLFMGFLDELLYVGPSLKPDERLDRTVEVCRSEARVAYEGIREQIGRLGARIQVVERFAARCTRFDAAHVRAIGEQEAETGLTRFLALHLYDQGLPVVTQLSLGVHRMDVAATSGEILVEAKQYDEKPGPSEIKRQIIRGIYQVHAYLSNLAADAPIREAYLAVFRRSGPLVDIVDAIRTPRFSIYPVLIDVGEAKDSGRKQPKPIVITEADVLAKIEEEEGTENA